MTVYFCKAHILKQFFGTAIISLCMLSDGMQFGWQSPATTLLKSNESNRYNERIKGYNHQIDVGIQVSFLVAGVGCMPGIVYLADKIGRKWTNIMTSSLNLLSWISIALTTHAWVLVLSKVLASIAYCADMVVLPLYASEVSEKKIRGFCVAYIFMNAMFGIIVVYSIFPFTDIWVTSCVGAALHVVQITVFTFLPESPYYLLKKNKNERAKKSLQYFREDDVTNELEEVRLALEEQAKHNARLIDAFKDKHTRRALVIGSFLQFMVPLSGLSMITMNLHDILGDERVFLPAEFTSIGFASTLFAAQILCMFTIDYFGRKPLLLFSIVGCNLMLFSFATYFTVRDFHPNSDYTYAQWVPESCMFLYAICYRLGLGTVPATLCAEMFPLKHKAAGMSVTFVVMTIVDALVVVVFKEIGRIMKSYYSFFIFVGISVLNFPFVLYLVPETKGKTLEEIQTLMGTGWVEREPKFKKGKKKGKENPDE